MKKLVDVKPILAIETSENICGVCVYYSDDKYFSSSIHLKHSHSEKIFELIKNLFQTAKINSTDLDSIAVSEGPGSFTGLRIGFSAAKGIAHGANLPITPVPTYEAFAFQLSSVLGNNAEFIISNKVNRDEVYFTRFQIRGNNYIFGEELTILTKELFIQKAEGYKVFGNSGLLLEQNNRFPMVPDPLYIAKWAVEFGKDLRTYNFDFLEPNYLKEFIIKEKSK